MRDVFVADSQPLALMVGCTIIVMLGLADDKWGLDTPTKFVGQVLRPDQWRAEFKSCGCRSRERLLLDPLAVSC